ncbi:MAG: type 2 isopentenyl-diphosphate Delta-isomerase [Bdellovibrionales bacterium]|nr:type 2 isopentenyl-diphosphate Delta-isomerase [Bdellovibrionales bacterium]
MKPATRPSSLDFEKRKKDHIDISLREESQAFVDQFSRVELQHCALPEIDYTDVTIGCEVFSSRLKSPLFVSSMTLGHDGAKDINHIMAKLCEERGWMMGVGSQRRQLFDSHAYSECEALREQFPHLVLFGNLGLSQVIQTPVEKVQSLVDSLGAQFLVVHTNPLQEVLQDEGTPQFAGGVEALAQLCAKLGKPVVLKETGCGFSLKTFELLSDVGLAAIDVSGMGGTHWGRVEGLRLPEDSLGYQVAETFKDWGLSTVDSVLHGNHSSFSGEIWASGGVRNGLEAGKLLVLGASKVGLARPILQAALQGELELAKLMERLETELKIAMFCLGCAKLPEIIGKRDLWVWK